MDFFAINHYLKNRISIEDSSSDSNGDSDTEEELLLQCYENRKIKTNYFLNYVIPTYNDVVFQSHFRLTRTAVESFLKDLGTMNPTVYQPGTPKRDLQKCFLITLWTLANQESYRAIGERFDVGKGEVQKIFLTMCKKIHELRGKYIKFPNGRDQEKAVSDFNSLRGNNSFPNVVGCIDCSHIEIPAPSNYNSYYNWNGYHSVVLQGVCNAQKEFIDVFCGWPGSSHDSRIWKNSPLYTSITEDNLIENGDTHLLGDSAYPVKWFLSAPYRDNGHLSAQQKYFNYTLSSSRIVIEHAFGRLKNTFRRLFYLDIKKIENVKYVIISACVLYNICVKENGQHEELLLPDLPEIPYNEHNNDRGNQKRRFVTELLWYNRH